MAILWLDSFSHLVTADLGEKYTAATGGPTISTTGGRRSGGCAQIGAGAVLNKGGLAPGSTTAIVGFAFKTTAFAATSIFHIVSSGTNQISIALTAGGLLQLLRGATVLGSGGPIALNTYYFIDLKVVIHATTGSATLRVNEATIVPFSGNTANSGSAAWDAVSFVNSAGLTASICDLHVLDSTGIAPTNDTVGDARVDPRYPTAEGASSAWTPSSGTDNALMVDETAPDDDTTYNSTATVNAVDTHVVQDAPVVGATLFGVQLVLSRKKTDAGTCSIAPVVRVAGTDYVGTASNPSTSYTYGVTPYSTNPATGAAWTEADFNAAEFGYKRTA